MDCQFIYAKRVLAGKKLTPFDNCCVIVEDGRISRLLPRAEAEKLCAPDTLVTDLGDVTLMPGLIEAHNHLALDARLPGHLGMMNDGTCRLTMLALNSLRDDLQSGVTTARCMGDRDYIDLTLKAELEKGTIPGPRLIACGVGMRGAHGHGFVGVAHSGPEEFRRTARENMLRGCDHLKVFITGGAPPKNGTLVPYYLSLEEMRTVAEEGARLGLPVSAHCIGGTGLRVGVEAGVRNFDHLYCVSDDEIELLIKNNCWAVLTSGVFLDPGREVNCPPFKVANVRRCRESVYERMRALIASGVRYALGTDAYHANLWREVVYARECGASAVDALRGVTVWAAELCGLGDTTGSLEQGYLADMAAFGANPLDDPKALADVRFVMLAGRIARA